MEKKADPVHSDEWLKDIPLTAENPAFAAEEMISCAKCARTNPPTRLKCLYCGTELEFSAEQSNFIKLNLRKLDVWEKGFNLIYKSQIPNFDEAKMSEIAKLLKLELDKLQKLLGEDKPLPLARTETEKEASVVHQKLREFGVEAIILSDETLKVENLPKRLRGVEFWDDKIILVHFNTDEIVEISNDDLILIVSGAIFERKVEALEQRSRKEENKLLQIDEITSDEFLIDVYSRQNTDGYRIYAKGFDFSSLEADKGLVAADNLRKLIKKLREVAPNAKFVDDYLQLRESLGNVWEVEHKTDSQGIKRGGVGSFNLANVTTAGNLLQFTKYSRLRRHIL